MNRKAFFEELDRRFGEDETLREFSLPEAKALIDLAFVVIMVDRKVTEEETDALRDQLETLPFATKQQAKDALSDHIDRACRAIAHILQDDGSIDSYIQGAAARIQSPEHRRRTLQVLSVVSFADEPHPQETTTFFKVGDAFGWDRPDISELWVDQN